MQRIAISHSIMITCQPNAIIQEWMQVNRDKFSEALLLDAKAVPCIQLLEIGEHPEFAKQADALVPEITKIVRDSKLNATKLVVECAEAHRGRNSNTVLILRLKQDGDLVTLLHQKLKAKLEEQCGPINLKFSFKLFFTLGYTVKPISEYLLQQVTTALRGIEVVPDSCVLSRRHGNRFAAPTVHQEMIRFNSRMAPELLKTSFAFMMTCKSMEGVSKFLKENKEKFAGIQEMPRINLLDVGVNDVLEKHKRDPKFLEGVARIFERYPLDRIQLQIDEPARFGFKNHEKILVLKLKSNEIICALHAELKQFIEQYCACTIRLVHVFTPFITLAYTKDRVADNLLDALRPCKGQTVRPLSVELSCREGSGSNALISNIHLAGASSANVEAKAGSARRFIMPKNRTTCAVVIKCAILSEVPTLISLLKESVASELPDAAELKKESAEEYRLLNLCSISGNLELVLNDPRFNEKFEQLMGECLLSQPLRVTRFAATENSKIVAKLHQEAQGIMKFKSGLRSLLQEFQVPLTVVKEGLEIEVDDIPSSIPVYFVDVATGAQVSGFEVIDSAMIKQVISNLNDLLGQDHLQLIPKACVILSMNQQGKIEDLELRSYQFETQTPFGKYIENCRFFRAPNDVTMLIEQYAGLRPVR